MADEERYSNRQIERMLDEQSQDLKDHFDVKIEPLTAQVKKTNGTVGWLTKMVYMALGALAIAIPVLTWVTSEVVKIEAGQQQQIQAAVNQAFEDNLQYKSK